jgi:hypothetical protein
MLPNILFDRLLVLSALSDKKMMLSMYDLETLKNLATKETKFVGIGRSSILWQVKYCNL